MIQDPPETRIEMVTDTLSGRIVRGSCIAGWSRKLLEVRANGSSRRLRLRRDLRARLAIFWSVA